MDVLVLDPKQQVELFKNREGSLASRYDEVWDGVYVMSPHPNDEHQELVNELSTVLTVTIGWTGLGVVRPGVNVTDQEDDWTKNYRCPDVVVYRNGTHARNRGSNWLGGPDFLVEVVSRHDKSREKLDFYAKVGSREVLVVDRYPWSLELYRRVDGRMALIGRSTVGDPTFLASEVVPLSFRLVEGDSRASIEMVHADGVQRWSV